MAKDIYHNSVKEALVKDEWIITHDPYIIRLGDRELNILIFDPIEKLILEWIN